MPSKPRVEITVPLGSSLMTTYMRAYVDGACVWIDGFDRTDMGYVVAAKEVPPYTDHKLNPPCLRASDAVEFTVEVAIRVEKDPVGNYQRREWL